MTYNVPNVVAPCLPTTVGAQTAYTFHPRSHADICTMLNNSKGTAILILAISGVAISEHPGYMRSI